MALRVGKIPRGTPIGILGAGRHATRHLRVSRNPRGTPIGVLGAGSILACYEHDGMSSNVLRGLLAFTVRCSRVCFAAWCMIRLTAGELHFSYNIGAEKHSQCYSH